jgi:hypothetical protein
MKVTLRWDRPGDRATKAFSGHEGRAPETV